MISVLSSGIVQQKFNNEKKYFSLFNIYLNLWIWRNFRHNVIKKGPSQKGDFKSLGIIRKYKTVDL